MPSIRSILAYGLSTLSVVSGYSKDHCEKHGLNMANARGTGKKGGGEFCASQIKNGVLVNGLECWADGNSLRALKFYFTDKSEMMVGSIANMNSRTINGRVNWNPVSDTIDWLRLWDNGWNGIIGRIDMKASNGQRMDCGKYANWGPPSVDVDRGAGGMMIGAEGGAGDGIDFIKFLFTSHSPSRVELKKLEIPAVATNQGLKSVQIRTLRIINRSENETLSAGPFHWKDSVEKKRHSETTETNTFGFDQKISINVGLPKEASIGTEIGYNWSTEKSTTTSSDDNSNSTLEWSISDAIKIAPGKAKVITIMGTKAEIPKATYKAKMEVTFKDSSKFVYDTTAEFEFLQYDSQNYIFDDEDAAVAFKQIGQTNSTLFANLEVDKNGNDINKKVRRAFTA